MKTLATNKRARHDYELLESFEAGIDLTGAEVKSVKAGHLSLAGAHAAITARDAMLLNMHISAYGPAGTRETYDAERSRRLLLHRRQIEYLRGKTQEQGLTVVPVRVYHKGNLIKLELALARGKKKHDKRAAIKAREQGKMMRRALKEQHTRG